MVSGLELPAQLPQKATLTVDKFEPFTVSHDERLEYVMGTVFVILPPTNVPLSGVKGKPRKIESVAVQISIDGEMCVEEFIEYLFEHMKDELEQIWKTNRDKYISRMYAN